MGEGGAPASEIMQLFRQPRSSPEQAEVEGGRGVPASGRVAAPPEQHTHHRPQAPGPRMPKSRAPKRVRDTEGATWERGEAEPGSLAN